MAPHVFDRARLEPGTCGAPELLTYGQVRDALHMPPASLDVTPRQQGQVVIRDTSEQRVERNWGL